VKHFLSHNKQTHTSLRKSTNKPPPFY